MIFNKILRKIPSHHGEISVMLSNSNKSLMKCGELFNKHFCKNKILLSPMKL